MIVDFNIQKFRSKINFKIDLEAGICITLKPRLLCNLALPKSVDPDIDIRYNGDVAEEDQVPEPSETSK